jgi:hypothetical protein
MPGKTTTIQAEEQEDESDVVWKSQCTPHWPISGYQALDWMRLAMKACGICGI